MSITINANKVKLFENINKTKKILKVIAIQMKKLIKTRQALLLRIIINIVA